MTLPVPLPGLVLHYAYLWRSAAQRQATEAVKHRPCVILATVAQEDDGLVVYVAPITHLRPRSAADGIEIPPITKQRLGLDDAPSWMLTSEMNRFLWPGFDLRPIPTKSSRECAYGMLPPKLFDLLKHAVAHRARSRRLETTRR